MKSLSPIWGEGETAAILRMFWEAFFNKQKVYPFLPEHQFSALEADYLEMVFTRLSGLEPIQYILEKSFFLDLELFVNSNVLIPRPETEELVLWILKMENQIQKSVLDLCTGSGCIALSLFKKGSWQKVSALDVSKDALEVAKKNEEMLDCKLIWIEKDLLSPNLDFEEMWDVWVSNPPYVLESEAEQMATQVLDFEPKLALFVPDSDPLLFYKIITNEGFKNIRPGGLLFFEINPAYASHIQSLMLQTGFQNIELKKDMFGKERMIKGTRPDF